MTGDWCPLPDWIDPAPQRTDLPRDTVPVEPTDGTVSADCIEYKPEVKLMQEAEKQAALIRELEAENEKGRKRGLILLHETIDLTRQLAEVRAAIEADNEKESTSFRLATARIKALEAENEKLRAEYDQATTLTATTVNAEIELGRKVDALSARASALEKTANLWATSQIERPFQPHDAKVQGAETNEATVTLDKPVEWPEVVALDLGGNAFVIGRAKLVGLHLTRAEAEAVVRAYRWMVDRAAGRNLSEGMPDARRILEGGGK